MRLNTMKTIAEYRGKINPYYDMRLSTTYDIHRNSKDDFDIMSNAFIFGYAQGMKAAKKRSYTGTYCRSSRYGLHDR